MKPFLDESFLLDTDTAAFLYESFAKDAPIIDYHCHLDARDIALDRRFKSITEVWLGGDHYKWRLMRAHGVEERFITGDAGEREKFDAWVYSLEKAIGNPLYHWSHLELRRYFGFEGALSRKTADEVWKLTERALGEPSMSARGLIKRSGVELICTTDDPIDDLRYHKQLAEDESFGTRVLPAWRPDRAMNIEKSDYLDYLGQLEAVCGMRLDSFGALMRALEGRMEYFCACGCCTTDHGLERMVCVPAEDGEVEAVFAARLRGEQIGEREAELFKTAFLRAQARVCKRLGLVMQLHYGCERSVNPLLLRTCGADTGGDCITGGSPSLRLASFLGLLESDDSLPRMIVYSLDPSENALIDTVIGSFQRSGFGAGKLQHGSAWWFNDNLPGMQAQLTSLASLGALDTFVGMLTDSRSFLSYPRHEYFRRIFCALLGRWVENGEYPYDKELLGEIVRQVAHDNAQRLFSRTS